MHNSSGAVKGDTKNGARDKRVEQGDATKNALVTAARELFAERGFAATGTHDVVRHAGVTRGPLYYHFADKTDLFRVVFVELEQELNEHVIAAASRETSPWDMFVAGCGACLDFFLRPDYRQIVLIDGPAVLGVPEWHALDTALGRRSMEQGVRALIGAGVIRAVDAAHLTTLLFGALNQAGMELAHAEDPQTAKHALLTELEQLLRGLRAVS